MKVYGNYSRVELEEHISTGRPLSEIQIKDADFPGLNCMERTLENSYIYRSHLDDARFSRSCFSGGFIEQSNIRRGIFTHCRFDDFTIRDSLLLHGNFEKAEFYHSRIKSSMAQKLKLKNTLFYGGSWQEVEARKSRIIESVFMGTTFRFEDSGGLTGFHQGELLNNLFFNCSFRGYAFHEADLTGSVFIRCVFEGIDWEDVGGLGAQFTACSGIPSWFVSTYREPVKVELADLSVIEKIKEKIENKRSLV